MSANTRGVRLLPTADAAAYCDVDAGTMRRWMREGVLVGARRVLGRWYVDQESLDRFIRPSRDARNV